MLTTPTFISLDQLYSWSPDSCIQLFPPTSPLIYFVCLSPLTGISVQWRQELYLFYSLLYSPTLEESLAHSRCSINIRGIEYFSVASTDLIKSRCLKVYSWVTLASSSFSPPGRGFCTIYSIIHLLSSDAFPGPSWCHPLFQSGQSWLIAR